MTLSRTANDVFARWFTGSRRRRLAADLYLDIVAQARQPAFYRSLAVPDTLDGRFDMIVLHAFLVLRHLRTQGPEAEALSQALFDYLLSDMDQSLRESGVGDLSVGKHVKRMAKAFYGRAAAYGRALDGTADGETMQDALARNLYRSSPPPVAILDRMADYVRGAAVHLEQVPLNTLLDGNATFPEVSRVETAMVDGGQNA